MPDPMPAQLATVRYSCFNAMYGDCTVQHPCCQKTGLLVQYVARAPVSWGIHLCTQLWLYPSLLQQNHAALVHRAVLVVKRFGMPIICPNVALLMVLYDLTVLLVYLTTCTPSRRPNTTAHATADALIGASPRTRAVLTGAQLLLNSFSQMNLPSSLSIDSSGGQQASRVQLQPEHDFPDLLPRVQAGRLRAGAATGSATRCASNVSSSLPCSQLDLPHEVAQGGCCLHDKCVRQNS